jgi:hypothetical protein
MSHGLGGATLRLGAVRDDASPAWMAFYPEGLPEDWRLPFYAHYWKDLLVPSGEWVRLLSDPGWLDGVPDDLALYFEVPSFLSEAGAAMQTLAEALGTQLGGFLLDHDAVSTRPGLIGPRFVRVPFPSMPGALAVAAYAGKTGSVLVVEPRPGLSLRLRRDLLEALVRAMPDHRQRLFLRGSPVELEDAETILRLAGFI